MKHRSIAVASAVALFIACGGAIEPSTDRGAGTRTSTSTPTPDPGAPSEPPKQASSKGPPPSDPGASDPGASKVDCSSFGTQCQVFEPGGPERWGCNTVGSLPELACERAAGASIARCNCQGNFGECAPGASCPFTWFDVPATSTFFTDDELRRLWKEVCGGTCG
jgi:hypothetical protein